MFNCSLVHSVTASVAFPSPFSLETKLHILVLVNPEGYLTSILVTTALEKLNTSQWEHIVGSSYKISRDYSRNGRSWSSSTWDFTILSLFCQLWWETGGESDRYKLQSLTYSIGWTWMTNLTYCYQGKRFACYGQDDQLHEGVFYLTRKHCAWVSSRWRIRYKWLWSRTEWEFC